MTDDIEYTNPVCRGSVLFGNACLRCERCQDQIAGMRKDIEYAGELNEQLKENRKGWADALATIGVLSEKLDKLHAENQFLKSFLKMHSPQMTGNHSWRWQTDWRSKYFRGNSPDKAVNNAIVESKRELDKTSTPCPAEWGKFEWWEDDE